MHADLQAIEPAVSYTDHIAEVGTPETRPVPSSNRPDYADYIENAEDEIPPSAEEHAQNTEAGVMPLSSHQAEWSSEAALPQQQHVQNTEAPAESLSSHQADWSSEAAVSLPQQQHVQSTEAAVKSPSSHRALWSTAAAVPQSALEHVQNADSAVAPSSPHRTVWSSQAAVPLPQQQHIQTTEAAVKSLFSHQANWNTQDVSLPPGQGQGAEPAVHPVSLPQSGWNAAAVIPSSQQSAWSAVAAELSQQQQVDSDSSEAPLQQQNARSHAADVPSLQQVIPSVLLMNMYASCEAGFPEIKCLCLLALRAVCIHKSMFLLCNNGVCMSMKTNSKSLGQSLTAATTESCCCCK